MLKAACVFLSLVSQSEDGAKRQKLSEVSPAMAIPSSSPSSSSSATAVGKSGIRRSMRHRKLRGEKALIVSANQTLKELKIQVCSANLNVFHIRQFWRCVLTAFVCVLTDHARLLRCSIWPKPVHRWPFFNRRLGHARKPWGLSRKHYMFKGRTLFPFFFHHEVNSYDLNTLLLLNSGFVA